MSSLRTIIHLDLDAFFCAVEEQRDPSLRGKPFAVGGRPESRGVVSSASYAARQFGVRSAIPMAQAVRLCPELILVANSQALSVQVAAWYNRANADRGVFAFGSSASQRSMRITFMIAVGMHTIGDIAAWPAADLARRFGQHGEDLVRRACGIDTRPIVTERAAKSISQETTFARDVTDRAMLERTLREQAAEIAQKLRREDLMGTTIKLKIRWPDFTTPTRQLTLPQPTDEPEVIAEAALRLFGQIWTGEQAVRLIGVGVSGLGAPPIPALPAHDLEDEYYRGSSWLRGETVGLVEVGPHSRSLISTQIRDQGAGWNG